MHWKTPASPRMKQVKMSKSKFTATLIVFSLHINGIVITAWIPDRSNCEPNLIFEIFGSTPRERVTICKCSFATRGTLVIKHTPYSSDLVPCNFLLFPKIKSVLKGTLVWVDGRGEVKIGRAPKCSYKRRLPALLWPMEKLNRTLCDKGGEYIEEEHSIVK